MPAADDIRLEDSGEKSLETQPAERTNLLVVGIGNCGRADDGLGWAFLDQLEAQGVKASLAYQYQLQIEDAEKISHHPAIIFVDATEEILPEGFKWQECRPTGSYSYSTHALEPGAVTILCQQLYDATPKVYILAIQGVEWGLKEGLSKEAQKNLLKALKFMNVKINQFT